jgi:hypothetical protein
MDIELPHNGWHPRPYQEKLWRYLEDGGKRAFALWHRRSGKDEICLHHAARAAMERPGNYAHCLPEFAQGRKSIWTAVNPHSGLRRIDEAFPREIRVNTSDNEMFLRFINGSTWSVMGSDRYDTSIIGSSLAGITFSEFALAKPGVWGFARPMLEENNGWAVFITTPRGPNHAKQMFEYAQTAPGWFAERLTIHDSKALSQEVLAETLSEYMALYGDAGRAVYEQEYEVSFNAAILGAFYGREMAAVRQQGRILEIEPIAGQPVHRAWDIGVRHDTSIWWFQVVGAQVFVLAHYAASGVGLDHYIDVIDEYAKKYGLKHGIDYVPHDAKVREFTVGRTRIETMALMGLNPCLVPDHTLADGINAVRRTLPLCVFHPRCEQGISALEQYRREWDDDKRCFRASAVADWTSDSADSFRYLSMAWKPAPIRTPQLRQRPQNGGIFIPPVPPRRERMRI